MNKILCLTITTLLLMGNGCATRKPLLSTRPVEPLVQVIPPQGRETPRVAEISNTPEPIYINPIIEEVEMASYINDEGNLVFPGKVLVIRQPGRWNLAAAQKNRQYFVPADNQPPQLTPPSKSYYDYIQSKRNGRMETILDVSRVRVLGFFQKEDRPAAQARLLPGETTAFDPHLGWLAIPEAPIVESHPSDAIPPAAPPVSPGSPAFQEPARLENSPPPLLPTNSPPTGTDNAETAKKLRSILEDAFKNAEQARENENHQPQKNDPAPDARP